MWANESRSDMISTQLHPTRSAQVAAESSASSPGRGDRVEAQRVQHRAGPVQLVDQLRVLLGRDDGSPNVRENLSLNESCYRQKWTNHLIC